MVWNGRYSHLYETIDTGSQFLQQLDQIEPAPHSFADGIERYSTVWFKIDQLYRQFIYHLRQAGAQLWLEALSNEVENRYTNQFLLPLNDQWQRIVDDITDWHAIAQPRQMDFYEEQVAPFLRRGKKVFVIISDALRYEVGAELVSRIRQEDRYEAALTTAVTALPSYTQLGMAALLPHDQLSLGEDGKTVFIDGKSSAGTANRSKILAQATDGKGVALQSDAFLNMGRESSRALFRDYAVVYIYHNRIDAVGDKRESEERTVDAAETTMKELILLIKKAAAANVSNLLITADHGFIYQHQALDESDFLGEKAVGTTVLQMKRRYVVGHGLVESSSFKKLTAVDVGLGGDMEMLLPKSINRLRLKGAGSRFVHGGASLQEIVVPVIHINKKRKSDITSVNVDVLRGSSTAITTGQITIRFYQTEPATDKVQPLTLRVGLYSQSGELISNQYDLIFDFTSENARDRELTKQFILTHAADKADGQEIVLRLEKPVVGTSHYKKYKDMRYTLKRTFGSDFDF